jgi:hypothetical protein
MHLQAAIKRLEDKVSCFAGVIDVVELGLRDPCVQVIVQSDHA